MSINIRPMTRGDKPAVMKILRNTTEFTEVDLPVAEEVIDCYLNAGESSGYITLVAEVDSAIAGYICYGPTAVTQGTWDVFWTAVAPDKRKQGIGGTMLSYIEKKIREADGRMMVIETSSTEPYAAARKLYYKQNWEAVALIEDYYAPGDHEVIFVKRLK